MYEQRQIEKVFVSLWNPNFLTYLIDRMNMYLNLLFFFIQNLKN